MELPDADATKCLCSVRGRCNRFVVFGDGGAYVGTAVSLSRPPEAAIS